jgi:protein SCO1
MFWQRSLRPLYLALGILVLCTNAAASAASGAKGGDFTLEGPNGPLALSDLRGKVVLIFFGYTSCPDVCPISLARINASFSAMSEDERERVRALFITLDPQRDTRERLAKYTSYFHPNIIGLRDDDEAIGAVTRLYGVEYAREEMPGSELGYSISHPTDIFLVDAKGRLIETIPHDARSAHILARVRELLNVSD